MPSSDVLMERCLAIGTDVRYVAVYRDGSLDSRQRPGLSGASASESDRYEELIVNPAVLTLLKQRGEIDCGGLRFVLIRYGNFLQFVHPIRGGHVSVALEPGTEVSGTTERLRTLLVEWDGA